MKKIINILTFLFLSITLFSCKKDYEKIIKNKLDKLDELTCIKLANNILDSIDDMENYKWGSSKLPDYKATEKTELAINDMWKFHADHHSFKDYKSLAEWMYFYNDPEHVNLVTKCYFCNLEFKVLAEVEKGYYPDLGNKNKYMNTCLKAIRRDESRDRIEFIENHFMTDRINQNRENFYKIRQKEIEEAKKAEQLAKEAERLAKKAQRDAEYARKKAEQDKKREEERKQQELINKKNAEEMYKLVSKNYENLPSDFKIIKEASYNTLTVTAKNDLVSLITIFKMNKKEDSYSYDSIYYVGLITAGVKQGFYADYNDPFNQFTMMGRFTGIIENLGTFSTQQ